MIKEFGMLSGMGVEDARMTAVYRVREFGWYEDILRADECS